jgi:hypothetical protein
LRRQQVQKSLALQLLEQQLVLGEPELQLEQQLVLGEPELQLEQQPVLGEPELQLEQQVPRLPVLQEKLRQNLNR